MTVGDRVRIERDETPYPSKGAWPQFLGRTGTIIEVNLDRKRPRLTEFGVSFGTVTKALDGHRREFNWDAVDVAWFKAYEMASLAAVRPAELQQTLTPIADTTHREIAA